MVKFLALLVFVTVLAGTLAASTYTTKYDGVNLDDILNNERVYRKYMDCLTNKGKCTPDGKELKEHLSDALQTQCAKCSDKQREGSEKVLTFLLVKKPQDFLAIEKIYDPERHYRQNYAKQIKERGLKFPD